MIRIGLVALVVLLTSADVALAWGLPTHMRLAQEVLWQLSLLPAGVAALLSRHVVSYLFGNIAADVVCAKRLSRVRQFCHRWPTGLKLLEGAETESGRAFALGYLSHLAADTVAHNRYVPERVSATRTPVGLGHPYWELRADAAVGRECWEQVRSLLRRRYPEHEALLRPVLAPALLHFDWNRAVFYTLHLALSHEGAVRAAQAWHRVSRHRLDERMLESYRAEAVERMVSVVSEPFGSAVLGEDPNGSAALAVARWRQREMRRRFRRHRRRVRREALRGPLVDLLAGDCPGCLAGECGGRRGRPVRRRRLGRRVAAEAGGGAEGPVLWPGWWSPGGGVVSGRLHF